MKNTRRLGKIIFLGVTGAVFLTGTFFAFVHRSDPNADLISKNNILAVACGAFLTIAELALVFAHHLIHESKEFWRRGVALLIAIGLAGTITYATFTEAQSFLEEGNIASKQAMIKDLNQTQLGGAKGRGERKAINTQASTMLKDVLDGAKTESFKPFSVNAAWGLIAALLLTFISPREPWKRRKGNVMTDELRAKVENKIGFGSLPEGARAYDDGKGSSVVIKKGREYLGSIPKSEL